MLKYCDTLATFFFNEINRARPQVHALLLRAMAEHSINAFNRDYHFPHIQVFADRNRVKKEETFGGKIINPARFYFAVQPG